MLVWVSKGEGEANIPMKEIYIDVCRICGWKCRYCTAHFDTVGRGMMSPEHFLRIADILRTERYERALLYFSGESILNPDLFTRFIPQVRERGIRADLATRLGYPIHWDLFAKAPPDVLVVSVDSLRQEVTENIAPGCSWDVLQENLDSLEKVWAENRTGWRLIINVNVTSANVEELPDLVRWANARYPGCRFGSKAIGLGFGCATDHEEADAARRGGDLLTDKFPEQRVRVNGDRIIPLNADPRWWPQGRRCTRLAPVVGYEGTLLPCCHDFHYRIRIGNVLEAGTIDGLLATGSGRKIMEAASRMELPICRVCG